MGSAVATVVVPLSHFHCRPSGAWDTGQLLGGWRVVLGRACISQVLQFVRAGEPCTHRDLPRRRLNQLCGDWLPPRAREHSQHRAPPLGGQENPDTWIRNQGGPQSPHVTGTLPHHFSVYTGLKTRRQEASSREAEAWGHARRPSSKAAATAHPCRSQGGRGGGWRAGCPDVFHFSTRQAPGTLFSDIAPVWVYLFKMWYVV